MEKKSLILIGGGGHCKACIEVVESGNEYVIAGILDKKERIGEEVCGYKILDTENELPDYVKKGFHFLVTVGQIKDASIRRKLYQLLLQAGAKIATIISRHAIVSVRSIIGAGTIVMHGAIINADCVIGSNCIINTLANIEHDCEIGDHVHISTCAVLNGNCKVAASSFVGSHATLANSVQIGENVIIGAGAIVYKSIQEKGIYAGNPCRKLNAEQ